MIKLWEILVPHKFNDGTVIGITHHREWDRKVIELANGLTLLKKMRGKWTNIEDIMIPVRIACTEHVMRQIMRFSLNHYKQEAIMVYKISNEVLFEYAHE
jgi:hypothetical protein